MSSDWPCQSCLAEYRALVAAVPRSIEVQRIIARFQEEQNHVSQHMHSERRSEAEQAARNAQILVNHQVAIRNLRKEYITSLGSENLRNHLLSFHRTLEQGIRYYQTNSQGGPQSARMRSDKLLKWLLDMRAANHTQRMPLEILEACVFELVQTLVSHMTMDNAYIDPPTLSRDRHDQMQAPFLTRTR